MVAKLKRLVMISTSIMLIGFLAVMSVIAYRLVKSGEASARHEIVHRVLNAPAGARILAANGDDGRLYVTVQNADGVVRVHILDAETLTEQGIVETAPR